MDKIIAACALAALVQACSTGGTPEEAPHTPAPRPDSTATVYAWPGYYTATLPCADCPGIETTLWVRSDSTYILQRKYMGRDSVPSGMFGTWSLQQGDIVLGGERPEAPLRWKGEGRNIRQVALDGAAIAGAPLALEKLADEIGDEVPSMRVTGMYLLDDNAQSFRPCGTRTAWPAGMGLGIAEEEGEPLEPAPDVAAAYRKAGLKPGKEWPITVVGHLGLGPAAEGDGADEYFYVHTFIGPLEAGRCP